MLNKLVFSLCAISMTLVAGSSLAIMGERDGYIAANNYNDQYKIVAHEGDTLYLFAQGSNSSSSDLDCAIYAVAPDGQKIVIGADEDRGSVCIIQALAPADYTYNVLLVNHGAGQRFHVRAGTNP